MLTLPASVRVFVARGATDLRRSFDRLSAQVQEVLRQDPLSGHVFVFFNRQRNRVKMLVWERDGFWLLYKRLEAGTWRCRTQVARRRFGPGICGSIGVSGARWCTSSPGRVIGTGR